MRSGVLEGAINSYKYYGVKAWATIFGRVLAGFLEEQAQTFRQFSIIAASPTYVGTGGRSFDHTRAVLEAAARELPPGSGWPFDLAGQPVIIKTKPTEPMVGKKYGERRTCAESELRAALAVPTPSRTTGKNILVYDDVFTDGLTLNEIARALREQGKAQIVCGVTLCRQPWRRRPVETDAVPF
jgi:predicted amidophosphoribosyltransferase